MNFILDLHRVLALIRRCQRLCARTVHHRFIQGKKKAPEGAFRFERSSY
jgi:hypothetical protein